MADFRYLEDFPDGQVTHVPHSTTANKSTEEEKQQIPKKVGIVQLSLYSTEGVKIFFLKC